MLIMERTQATPGDVVEVSGRRIGDPGRTGRSVGVRGVPDHVHFLVCWDDGHRSLLFPGEGTTVRRPNGLAEPPRLLGEEGILELLMASDIDFELLPHRRTMTAASEARELGLLPQLVAKTVVVKDERGYARIVVPASSKLNLGKLADALGTKRMSIVTEGELVAAYPEFELGAVPPLGGPAGDRVVIDSRLADTDHLVFDAGVHDASLRLLTSDLIRVADAMVADVAT